MTRVLILVEGQTEETFVNEVLKDYLTRFGHAVTARVLGNARLRKRRGGIRSWISAKNDILRHLKEDRCITVSTMVDYYGLPETGSAAWPGRAKARGLAIDQRGQAIAQALRTEVNQDMGSGFDPSRFLPFVTMHEFEALLFSDPAPFSKSLGRPDLTPKIAQILEQFAGPEAIDDSPETAPSKRVTQIFPGYQKPLHGNIAVLEIGLSTIRAKCPHFSSWITSLENLP